MQDEVLNPAPAIFVCDLAIYIQIPHLTEQNSTIAKQERGSCNDLLIHGCCAQIVKKKQHRNFPALKVQGGRRQLEMSSSLAHSLLASQLHARRSRKAKAVTFRVSAHKLKLLVV